METKIYLLVGMIASGKSTYCKSAVKKGFLAINDDAIVNLLHADDYTLYEDSLRILYKSIENSVASLALCYGRPILVDRGVNVSENGRKRWIAIAHSFDVPCEAIVFPKDTAQVHAARRFSKDSRGLSYDVWLSTAMKHEASYSEPTLGEGLDKVHHITFDEITNGRVIDAY